MKAVTGSVTSSKPISLSKAAAILSRFAGTETGARRDIVAYLKRTSNALENLVHVHRELRADRKKLEVDSKEEKSEEKRISKKRNDGSSIALEHQKFPNGVTENGKVKNKKVINSEEEERDHTDRKKGKSLVAEEDRSDERRKKDKKKKKRERDEVENGRVSEEAERDRNGKKRRKGE